MARSNSPVLENTRGKLGDSLIIKQYSYGTVIAKIPRNPKREKSRRQKEKSAWFAEAVKYAKSIIRYSDKKTAYAATLPPGKLVYHAAMQEWLAEKKRLRTLPPEEEMKLLFADGKGQPVAEMNRLGGNEVVDEVVEKEEE